MSLNCEQLLTRGAGEGLANRRRPGAGAVGKLAAVPELDEPPGDRRRRRDGELAIVDGGAQLGTAEPARLADLLPVHDDPLSSRGDRLETEHQAARHRPWLAAQVTDLPDPDRGLLEDLARHRLLDGLPWLYEP